MIVRCQNLKTTIEDYDPLTGKGNGFVFDYYSKSALVKEIKTALYFYKQKNVWNQLMSRAVKYNFSWDESAKKYLDLYKKCTQSA